MVKLKDKSIYRPPETIRIVSNEGTQKLNVRSNNEYDLDEDFADYYQLFQRRKLICEAVECNIIATKELKLPIGIYGKQGFFFCENCINKFNVMNKKCTGYNTFNDNSISKGSSHKNIEKTTLVLDIQDKIFGPTTYKRKFQEHIKNGGDPDVF